MDMQLLLLLSALALGSTQAAQQCEGGGGGGRSNIIVDVISRRNATGHRHAKADLAVREEKSTAGDVSFHVEQSTHTISGVRHLHLTAYVSAPEPRVPPPGYELAPGLGWYRLHLQPLTWEEARLACEAEGAHLAVLNSPEEATALQGIFARAPNTIANTPYSYAAAIGFSDVVEGRYLTIFGDSIVDAGFAEWDTSQPNNGGGSNDTDSDCGALNRSGKINDMPCRSKLVYFCEYAL